jgi:cytochrome bd ubiquinol oxidase subunit I
LSGVVSGIVMPFQIGTNWSRFSDTTANVLASLLAYEGLAAFFLEGSFPGVLLFGRKLVPAWLHFFSGLMAAAGTLFSTFWFLSGNSWMQTLQGFHLAVGQACMLRTSTPCCRSSRNDARRQAPADRRASRTA